MKSYHSMLAKFLRQVYHYLHVRIKVLHLSDKVKKKIYKMFMSLFLNPDLKEKWFHFHNSPEFKHRKG